MSDLIDKERLRKLGLKIRIGVEGNCREMDGRPCFFCHKSEELDPKTRYDFEQTEQYKHTAHQTCYRKYIKSLERDKPIPEKIDLLFRKAERDMYGSF